MEALQHLEALPDDAFECVVRALYKDGPGDTSEAPASNISALAATCRCLRDAVQRVRKACYELSGTASCGQAVAEHLNRHIACTSLHIIRVKHLTISCSDLVQQSSSVQGSGPTFLDVKHVLLMARAFPGLETLTIRADVRGTNDLCAGLAPCCPNLRTLQARVTLFNAGAIGSLSALRRLTSLVLESKDEDELVEDDYEQGGDLAGLLQQLAALDGLTHLRLVYGFPIDYIPGSGGYEDHRVRDFGTFSAPPLTQLRSLELVGGAALYLEDLPNLAASFPCLERLRISTLQPSDDDISLVTIPQTVWCMRHLKAIEAEPGDGNRVDIQIALHMAACCPALESWPFTVLPVLVEDGIAMALRWLRDLGTLQARGLLGDVDFPDMLEASNADTYCAALDEFQPSELRAGVFACIRSIEYPFMDDDDALGRLVARLPFLRVVLCRASSLPVVAPLRHLTEVVIWLEASSAGHSTTEGAACCFVEHRAAALHPSATTLPASLGDDAKAESVWCFQPFMSIWDESSGGCLEDWTANFSNGACHLRLRPR